MNNQKSNYNLDISYIVLILNYLSINNNIELKESKKQLLGILESLKNKYSLDKVFIQYINYCIQEISGVVKTSNNFGIINSIELLETLMKHFCKDEYQYKLSTEVICCLKY